MPDFLAAHPQDGQALAAGNIDSPTEMAAIDVFNDRLRAEGHWVFAGGLGLPSTTLPVNGA